jgi:lipoprotein-anchoring transpeptidase ErfK/SrfK
VPRVSRPLAVGLAVTTAVAVLAVPGAGYAAYRQDVAQRGLLPTGAVVGGVDVGGLGRDAAVDAVRAVVQRDADRPAVVSVGERTVTVTARELGLTDDADAVVDTALAGAADGSWAARAWERLRGGPVAPDLAVSVTPPDRQRLDQLTAEVAADLERAPVDATVSLSGGRPVWTPSAAGQRVDAGAIAAALAAGLEDGAPREVALEPVAPAVTESAFGTVLVVRTGANVLELYKDQRLLRTYGIATGSPRHPTPLGRTSVTLKRYRPTWVNPGSAWATGMPASIGPGPGNPLGTRALNLGMPNIRIHGTPAAASIGYSVSHGCIRMRMADVEALYDLVPTGATVFVVNGGPPRLPASAAAVQSTTAATADGG